MKYKIAKWVLSNPQIYFPNFIWTWAFFTVIRIDIDNEEICNVD